MDQKTVLSYGEVLWDLLPNGAVLGGAPCNFAFRMHSLGNRSVMVSRLGNDHFGSKARDILAKLGMPLEGLQTEEVLPTGTVQVEFDENQSPDYEIIENVAYDNIKPNPNLESLAQSTHAICFGTLAQRRPASRDTLYWLLDLIPSNAIKICDINLRKNCYDQGIVEKSLRQANILKLSDEETGILSSWFKMDPNDLKKLGQQLVDQWNLDCCLITLGAKGALAFDHTENILYQPGFKIKLKDPVGAGDSCTAGFIHRYLNGAALSDCCRTGCGLGAMVATQSGATERIIPEDLDAFIQSNQRFEMDPRFEDLVSS